MPTVHEVTGEIGQRLAKDRRRRVGLTPRGIQSREQCVEGPDGGIQATKKGPQMVMQGLAIATALNPLIGYDNVAKLVHRAYVEDKTIREVALEKTDLTEQQIDEALQPLSMTEPKG